MYLSRLQLNPQRRGSRKLLSSPQAMHAAVLAGFASPEETVTETSRVLWRVDQQQSGTGVTQILLYVASPAPPDLTHLVEQAGWPTTRTWQTIDYVDRLAKLAPGQLWAFRLTANPVRNGRHKPDDAKTRRLGHVTVDQQREWLLSRAKAAGFDIPLGSLGEPDVVVHGRNTHTFKRNGSTVTLRVATYDGRLEVADPDALRRTMIRGLGHGKAYGCGLLTLAPLR